MFFAKVNTYPVSIQGLTMCILDIQLQTIKTEMKFKRSGKFSGSALFVKTKSIFCEINILALEIITCDHQYILTILT